jgi:electron transport complex protein RnfE
VGWPAAAIDNVLAAPARYDTLYVVDGALRETPPEGVLERDLERVFLGYDESDVPVGFAVTGGEPGYQDIIRLIFGYDPGSGEVVGMQVLESKETPGLGDKIEKDAEFVAEFDGVQAPLVGVKQGAGQGDPGEVDMITGATISSRTVIAIINNRLEELGPLLDTYPATVKRVLMGSSLLVSTFKRFIPHEVRISAYILIIATFVTIADLVLAAVVPEIHKALGAFIALIVVNCMILGRQEAFASKRPVSRAALDATGTGVGFLIAMLMMGSVREVLGNGTLLGYSLFGAGFEPWIIMILPPGGFLTLGVFLLAMGWWRGRTEGAQAQVRRWPHGVATRRAA